MAGSPTRSLARRLARIRRRAVALHLTRALLFGLAAAGALFFVASAWVGPTVDVGVSVAAWATVGLALLGVVVWAARPLARLRGDGAVRLLATVDPSLASRTRSALELARQDHAPHSADLVAAHAARVEEVLAAVEPRDAVPIGASVRLRLGLAALALAGAAAGVFGIDRATAGAFALLHPGAQEGRARVASIGADVRAALRYPAYMDRAPREIEGARIEAPAGTIVQWSMRPRVPLARATLTTPEGAVRLSESEGRWTGRFVVRTAGALTLEARDLEGRPLRDATARAVVLEPDHAPIVKLLSPLEDLMLEDSATVTFDVEARDDHGLDGVVLVVGLPGGAEQRVPFPPALPVDPMATLGGAPPSDDEALAYRGVTEVDPLALGARPGDVLRVWAEAADRDDVDGPNIGRSSEILLTLASEGSERAERIETLSSAVDAALGALADRLEAPVPEADAPARARHETVDASGQRLADVLDALHEDAADPALAALVPEMRRDLRRARESERRQYGRTLANHGRRVSSDQRLVTLLEDDALALADLLAAAKLEDAAAIARELESLRREMASLLAEVRRTDSPEARQALMAALRRAQRRMQELQQRLAAMREDVPSEFLNADALGDQEEAAAALDALDEALERGDLDAAARHMLDLEREIDALARSLQQAESDFGGDRFGPRQRAMAEALDRLVGLEAEERTLAERSDDVRRQAAQTALDAAGEETAAAARALAERAAEAREALDRVDPTPLGPADRETLERARQRLTDTQDALGNGDLGEARAMAEEAHADATRLARDLEISAMMFGGRRGEVAEAARRAGAASGRTRQLTQELDDALPRLDEHIDRAQREQLRADGDRQRRATEAAEALREAFAAEPDGAPLSPRGVEAMEGITEAMRDARQALQRGEPVGASRAQHEASRQLTELREELERNQNPNGGGGGEGGEPSPPSERVRIPGAEEPRGADELRRRLLEAMRSRAPRGYEDAVRRYYEDLLR